MVILLAWLLFHPLITVVVSGLLFSRSATLVLRLGLMFVICASGVGMCGSAVLGVCACMGGVLVSFFLSVLFCVVFSGFGGVFRFCRVFGQSSAALVLTSGLMRLRSLAQCWCPMLVGLCLSSGCVGFSCVSVGWGVWVGCVCWFVCVWACGVAGPLRTLGTRFVLMQFAMKCLRVSPSVVLVMFIQLIWSGWG